MAIHPLGILLVLFLSWGIAQGLPSLEKELKKAQEVQQKIEERIQTLNRSLAQISKTTQALLTEIRSLEAEIQRLEKERKDLQDRINLLKGEIEKTQRRISTLEKDLKALKERLKALMRSLYRERAGRYLPLLRAESFSDLAIRAKLIGYLSGHEQDTLRRLKATLEALKAERDRLSLLLEDLKTQEAAKEKTQALLEERRRRLLARLDELKKQEEGGRALLRESLNQRKALESQIAALQARVVAERKRLEEERRREEERRKREEERRRAHANAHPADHPSPTSSPVFYIPPPPLPETVGRLSFPIPGGRVVAAYGEEGPFQILAGPYPGSPVQAAADGYVSGILYVPNLGYTVVIAHTEALSTVYTNLQEPLVKEGQKVKRGEQIGYTGGGLLMPPEEIEFRVALLSGGTTRFVDPSAYY